MSFLELSVDIDNLCKVFLLIREPLILIAISMPGERLSRWSSHPTITFSAILELIIIHRVSDHVFLGTSFGWLDGQVAVTRHPYGQGMVTFIGAYLDEACQKTMLRNLVQEAGCKPVMPTPTGVEACRRVHPTHGEILILVNHTRSNQQVPLPWSAYEHLQQRKLVETLSLEPYGVAILTRQ
jgi:beta-galactosidase GanA